MEFKFDIISFLAIGAFVLGFIAIIQAYKYKKVKRLWGVNAEHVTLLNKEELNLNDIVIKYRSKPIDYIHMVSVYFLCSGNEVLRSTDFAESICIELDTDVDILNYTIESNNSYNSLVELSKDNSKVKFLFDYLEPKDFARIEIIYSYEKRIEGSTTFKIIGGDYEFSKFSLNPRIENVLASSNYSNRIMYLFVGLVIFYVAEVYLIEQITKVNLIEFFESNTNWTFIKENNDTYIISVLIGLILMVPPILIGFELHKTIRPFYMLTSAVKKWYKKEITNKIN